MIDARNITRDLGGKWYGNYGTAPCPVCQPERTKEQNALTLRDGHQGRLLLDCKKSQCDFEQLLAVIGISKGDYSPPSPEVLARREVELRAKCAKRATQARTLWEETRPIAGTLAELYLRRRGITCDLPETLRFHSACWHPTAKRLPALVSLVEGVENFAVHRTYLANDGRWKAALDPDKAMLGRCAGGAVQLSESPGPLVVAEGIETSLSLLSGLLCGPASIWAALSTSGVAGLHLPPIPGRLIVAPDSDDAGRNAAHKLAERAHALGWDVSLLTAPKGRDWNDVLNTKGAV